MTKAMRLARSTKEAPLAHPLEDTNFTHWRGDLETQLKRLHGVNLRDLGIDRRSLQDRFYSGESLFTALDGIARLHRLA